MDPVDKMVEHFDNTISNKDEFEIVNKVNTEKSDNNYQINNNRGSIGNFFLIILTTLTIAGGIVAGYFLAR